MLRISMCLLVAVGCVLAAPGPSNKISPELQNQTKANIIVFCGGTQSTLQSSTHNASRAVHSDSTLCTMLFLQTQNNPNGDADSELIQAIAQDDQVESITEEQIAHLIQPVDMKKVEALADEHQWGVVKIQAPEAWQELGTLSGEGVIIATVDTGVKRNSRSTQGQLCWRIWMVTEPTLLELSLEERDWCSTWS
ncbi:Subtilisin-like protease 1 [Orchesella cincta]|uniref:Subtilisin-like protease 1 n=1 Tax=Orchesella cincta TaxID=48709 RepID=A0A1D2MAV2_ORCCI|nr:Subtilisin-like protease 1 [Orchesella cincta]